jgi:thiol-disulfide isomerase/thioredoxin
LSNPQRRLWLGAGAAALLAGAGASAWKFRLQEPLDEAVSVLFQQSFPIAAGPSQGPTATASLALGSLQGKTVVLNFWATWCPPCVEEMPDLSKLVETWQRDLGEKVVTIGLGIDSIVNIQNFYKKLPVSYSLLAANAQALELVRLLGNPSGGLPFSVIISPQGKVSERILGRFESKTLDMAVRKVAASA